MSVRVKFLSRLDPREWARYFPNEDGRWHNCQFLFNQDEATYDWLIVYDDLPPSPGQARSTACETLRCPRENTILVTTEPSSIKAYGKHYAAQFGNVLTSQPRWALPHPGRHFQQAANHWFYGSNRGCWMSRQALVEGPAPQDKTGLLSTIFSPKRQWHTLHAQRFKFTDVLRRLMPEMDLFGRGSRPLGDKAEALAPYKYHLAIENHVSEHHITEKLTDAFLGRCLPFYIGAPNAADYFPAESFIALDIADPEGAARIIRKAIATDQWGRRHDAIEEARRRTLEEHHIFAVVTSIIAKSPVADPVPAPVGAVILGRHAWRKAHPMGAAAHMLEKLYVRGRALVEKAG